MIKNKKEVGIPLSKVETFDYDFEKQVLTINFDSKNSIWFNDIPEKIYSKFKDAMSDEASLFLISREHADFSDIKPLDIKDIPEVNKDSATND